MVLTDETVVVVIELIPFRFEADWFCLTTTVLRHRTGFPDDNTHSAKREKLLN